MNGNSLESSTVQKLIIGTVQFGLPYGISNNQGQVSRIEGSRILSLAHQVGINMLDTAIVYGDSETVLGQLSVNDWKIITKLPEIPSWIKTDDIPSWLNSQVTGSLSRLRVSALHGLLLHRPAQLASPAGQTLYRALIAQRESGRVKKIGVSIYGPDELEQMPPSMLFDIVQAPVNILDTRMIRSGWASRLAADGCELHARSIFLQGLLLMPAHARPAFFTRWTLLWKKWDGWLSETGLSPLQACVRYALSTVDVRRVVIGIDTHAHLAEILSAIQGSIPAIPADLNSDDPLLLNPSFWKIT